MLVVQLEQRSLFLLAFVALAFEEFVLAFVALMALAFKYSVELEVRRL